MSEKDSLEKSTKSRRFRVALSFAGEQRAFVEEVATILGNQFGHKRILYDKSHEAELAHPNLATLLPSLYSRESDLVVVFLSTEYIEREWTGLEWRAVSGLVMRKEADRVMLCRFNRVEPPADLQGLAGFLELDGKTPGSVASLILERLAINRERSANDDFIVPSGRQPSVDAATAFAPKLMARFQVKKGGKLRTASGGDCPVYRIDLWVEGMPEKTTSVAFEILHEDYKWDGKWTEEREPEGYRSIREFYTDELASYGDLDIWLRGNGSGAGEWELRTTLHQALVNHHGKRPTDPEVRVALRQIQEN